MGIIELNPCLKCGGKIEGYSSGREFIFFMRCMNCMTEYPLKTPIVLFKNSATKITRASINKANKEWNAIKHKENSLLWQFPLPELFKTTTYQSIAFTGLFLWLWSPWRQLSFTTGW